jgi:hypothetical protein
MKLAKRLLLVVLYLGVFQAGIVRSQSVPRTVLLEEGTNWACPPCAVANPYIEQFVKEHIGSVIQLSYHPNWPGNTDPMYLNDKTDNQERVATYYGVSGVPSVVFDGSDVFNPGGIGQMEAYWMIHANMPSPIALSVTHTEVGSSIRVDVTVKVVGDVSSYSDLYLRVAAVESEVDVKGPNGEPKYVNAMRTMMPSYQGTKLKIAKGDSLNYSFTYPIQKAYTRSRLYDVAFVQTDAPSHEVLQASSSQQTQQLTLQPGAQLFGRTTAEPSLGLKLSNRSAVEGTYKLRYFPTSLNPWSIKVNGVDATVGSTIILAPGASQDILLTAVPSTAGYTGGVIIASGPGGDTSSVPFKMIGQDVKTAFVDVFGDSLTEVQTELALIKLGERYAELSSTEIKAMNAWDKSQFPEIVVGTGKGIVFGNDAAGVQAYLAGGGHLLLHGGEIAFALADAGSANTNDKAFLNNVLHASYVKDSAGPRTIYGVSGDPITAGAEGPLNLYAQKFELNQPDQITANADATPIYYYGTAGNAKPQLAGLRFEAAATHEKLVYLAFGMENLATADEAKIVANSLKWFRESAAVAGTTQASNFALEQNYPNPFNPTTAITYSLDHSGPASLDIVDIKGTVVRQVFSNVQSSGQHSVVIDASSFASGVYFYELRSGSASLRRSMTLLK